VPKAEISTGDSRHTFNLPTGDQQPSAGRTAGVTMTRDQHPSVAGTNEDGSENEGG